MAQNCKVKLLEHGVLGVVGEDNTTRIRNVYSSVASGRAVYVNSTTRSAPLSPRANQPSHVSCVAARCFVA